MATHIKLKILNDKNELSSEEKKHLQIMQQPFVDFDALNETWGRLSRAMQKKPIIFVAYARAAIRLGQDQTLAKPLLKHINKSWNDELVSLVSDLKSLDQNKLFKITEKWQQEHPKNPTLLTIIATIAIRLKLWAKAETCLKQAIEIKPVPALYRTLGKLYENNGDRNRAFQTYKNGCSNHNDVLQ